MSRVTPSVQWIAWGLVTGVALGCELGRWWDPAGRQQALAGWLAGEQPDWLPFLPWLLLTPVVWWGMGMRGPARRGREGRPILSRYLQTLGDRPGQGKTVAWFWALAVFAVAFTMSWRTGLHFEGLPPAYHDEYSYLFQAETWLAGQTSFPSFAPMPGLFDQMHVLNEGRFASRYFPGAGLWIAPFLKWGDPWLGYQLAQALSAMFVFWAGRELATTGVGLLAGLLFALSPGLVLFSNLLLAHHPTLLGLTLFLSAFLRWLRSRDTTSEIPSYGFVTLAGVGLAFAMLCRPMTAAGFGLPFGIVFVSWWIQGWGTGTRKAPSTGDQAPPPRDSRTITVLCLGLPLLLGMLWLLLINWRITGSPWTSPYQLYTDIYTPRHVYGFQNVVRGERNLGPKVLDNYDRWADNLTPSLAVRNVGIRLVNSWRWTLGIVPLGLAGIVVLFTQRREDWRWWLVLAAILGLHLVHVPYWFTGIMGWHYVFETAPLWLLVFAEGTRRLWLTWIEQRRPVMTYWWLLLIILAVGVNLVTIPPLWPGRLDRGVVEVAYPRQKYAEFRQRIEELRQGAPVIVFVIPDPSDRHIDYVTNPPQLSGPVLVARLSDPLRLKEAAALFPERRILIFDAANREFRHE